MGIVLWVIGVISLLFGLLAGLGGKSAIHEILGGLGVLIFVVVMSSDRIVRAIGARSKS